MNWPVSDKPVKKGDEAADLPLYSGVVQSSPVVLLEYYLALRSLAPPRVVITVRRGLLPVNQEASW
jgi:hypothetical protein